MDGFSVYARKGLLIRYFAGLMNAMMIKKMRSTELAYPNSNADYWHFCPE